MNTKISKRITNLPPYAFAELEALVNKLKSEGKKVFDFGVGDPTSPTPDFVIKAGAEAIDKHKGTGYPSYIGEKDFRLAAAEYMLKDFGVQLDADTEIISSIGSKESVFNFPLTYIDPGDIVICPTPGYPPYKNGTRFAGGEVYFVPLTIENDFLIDFEKIPQSVVEKAKIIWINYPNSPTGKIAPKEWLESLVQWAHKNNIIIAADEGCYIDIYNKQKPNSILEVSKEGVIVFYSLSKRNNMTGWRVGFCAGDAEIISAFKKVKTNIDSGTPKFIQEAAVAALKDFSHIEKMRLEYQNKIQILVSTLNEIGIESQISEGTFYVWQKVPSGYTSVTFAKKLAEHGIIVTPGEWISDMAEGINPGLNHVRFSLVAEESTVREACAVLKSMKF